MEWNDVFKCLVLLFSNLIAICSFTILMVTLNGVKIGIVFSIFVCLCIVSVELVLFLMINDNKPSWY